MKPARNLNPARHHWAHRLVLVACVALIAACGSDPGTDPAAAPTSAPEPSDETSAGPEGEPITIRYASVGATGSEIMDQVEWFAEQVTERTNGQVIFDLFLDGTLVGAAETLAAVLDGRADVGYLCECYNPNEFPIWSYFSMPFHGNNAEAFMHTAADLYEGDTALTAEFEELGLHANWFHTIGAGLSYLREPIDGIEGLDGLRLRAIGRTAAALPTRGAEAVAMDPGEIYESVQRGVIDGVGTFFFPTAHAFGIHEVGPHIVDMGTGFYASIGFVINRDLWDSLPADVRAVFDEVSAELMDGGKAIEIYEEASGEACDAFLEEGGSVTIFNQADVTAWQEEVLPDMVEEWTESATASTGLTVEEADAFRQLFHDTYQENVAGSSHVPDAEACAQQQ